MANTQVFLKLNIQTSALTLIFLLYTLTRFLKDIKKLNFPKAAQSSDVPVKIFKDKADVFADYICRFFNESFNMLQTPTILKCANGTPLFEKGFRSSKKNYSKIFEKFMQKTYSVWFGDQNFFRISVWPYKRFHYTTSFTSNAGQMKRSGW